MSYVLAIDVGTSFTAAAIARTDRVAPPVPESLPLGLRGMSVPSVVYYPEEGPILVGEAAERRGLDSPERVVREFKRRIGDEVPISVGTLSLPAAEVFATMAGWVVDRAAEREGEPPSQVILSHPAAWGGHRTAVIREALAARGLPDVSLISEPEAAALHYASQVRVEDGSTIAVYDLGGGTFDTAILRKADSGRFEFLGRPEGIEGLGGADFDAAVLRHVEAHTGAAFAALNPADAAALAALARLRRECVEAKEALSADSEASISVFLPGLHQQVRLVRSELEAMIEEPLRETVDALERSLDELGLEAADLTAVLLIGGSSRIPLVAQLISEQLDRPIAVDADPKSSICLGAAVAALRARPVTAAEAVSALPETAVSADGAKAGTAAGAAMDPAPHTTPAYLEAHVAGRRASWSRKSGAALGSLAGADAHGVGARGHSGAHPGAHAPGAKAGVHTPGPTVRLTAVAAAAALFTGLTATAAQSPEGLGSLSAMFAPQEQGSAKDPAPAPDSGTAASGGGTAGPAASAAGGSQDPVRGIEASARKNTDKPASTAGIEAAASPTSTPSGSSSLPTAGTAVAAAGSTTDGTGGSAGDPGTTTADPAGTSPPDPGPANPVPEPTAEPPAPAPDPTTPAPQPDPTTPVPDPDPTTPAPEPDPTTPVPEPDPTTPAPEPDPTTPAPEPDPTTPAPEPTATETAAPVPTEPVV